MPLDGHSYLVAQGWSGKGSGLRQGAISRPLAIPQKKTLSGLGKDRDEAFPFWDHLFTVAAKTIQVKIHKDDNDTSDSVSEPSTSTAALPTLSRTSTGILSNKRPISGTPASSSGSSTPCAEAPSSTGFPSMSLIARAKRDAARRNLYSRFFRGPVLGPDSDFVVEEMNEVNEVKSTFIAPVAAETSRIYDVPRASSANIAAEEQEQTLKRLEKKKKKQTREKEEKKANVEGTEMKVKDRKDNEKAKAKKKRKDKSLEKELNPTTPSDTKHPKERKRKRTDVTEQDIQMYDRKPKRKRRREIDRDVELQVGVYVDASIKDDRKRDKKTKKHKSVVEEAVLAEDTAGHKSDAGAKAEKRRKKAEKVEKRRQKSAEAVPSQTVEVELP